MISSVKMLLFLASFVMAMTEPKDDSDPPAHKSSSAIPPVPDFFMNNTAHFGFLNKHNATNVASPVLLSNNSSPSPVNPHSPMNQLHALRIAQRIDSDWKISIVCGVIVASITAIILVLAFSLLRRSHRQKYKNTFDNPPTRNFKSNEEICRPSETRKHPSGGRKNSDKDRLITYHRKNSGPQRPKFLEDYVLKEKDFIDVPDDKMKDYLEKMNQKYCESIVSFDTLDLRGNHHIYDTLDRGGYHDYTYEMQNRDHSFDIRGKHEHDDPDDMSTIPDRDLRR
jgi:hypothetical protein